MPKPARILRLASAAILALAPISSLWAELPPLIPRDVLFGNPERTQPKLSPDAQKLAWIAPNEKGVLQVWVKTVGKEDGKEVTADKKRGIRQYWWAEDGKTLMYAQDNDGDENFHLFGADLASGNVRDLTPFQGVRAGLEATEKKFPDEILVSMNLRDRQLFDVYRVTLSTGASTLDTENPGDVAGWGVDAAFKVRAAQVQTPDGGTEIRIRDDEKSPWKSWIKVGPDENLNFLDFTADGKAAHILSSIGRDTAAVVRKEIASGAETLVAASDEVDAGDVLINPDTHALEAVQFAPGRATWRVLDPALKADFEEIAKLSDGDFGIVNRDRADATWLVAFDRDKGPVKWYTWDRKAKKGAFLLTNRPKLEGLALAEMKPVAIKSRDGLTLNSYLTLPVGLPPKNLPMVLFVHGGPWGRDQWGFNSSAQWFANRGWAVLQVNFRASTGYGKKFLNAGNRQWGLKMHDDLIDAVNWAVKQGTVDPKRVAIMGGSYGGYATLAGLAFTPEVFACGVDIVGPSNLKTLIGSIPPYWKPLRASFDVRMGNVDDPRDAELIRSASPLFKANQIVRPLLIGQGANDPRVNVKEAEQIVEAMEKNGAPVTYVLYPDEGHGFARPENRVDFNARAEAFLAKCLGGRAEPMAGERMPGSTAVVKVLDAKQRRIDAPKVN